MIKDLRCCTPLEKSRSNPQDVLIKVTNKLGKSAYIQLTHLELDNARSRATMLLGFNQTNMKEEND